MSPWRLFRAALGDYRRHWRIITAVLLLVSLPVAVLTGLNVVNPSSDTALSAYLALAQLAMNAALIYVIARLFSAKKAPGVRQAYYESSGVLIRLILVSVVLVLMLVPFLLGLLILGVLSQGAPVSGGEMALLIALAVVVIIPSVILVTRGLWAIYVLYETALGPIQALRQSWRLTRRKLWVTLGRLVALVLLLVLLVVVPVAVFSVLGALTRWTIFSVILQLSLTLLILPVGNLYLYRYYRSLSA